MNISFRYLFLMTVILILFCGSSFITHAQFIDGEREGLIFGGGIGYSVIAAGDESDSFTGSGFTTNGKVGYAISDQLAFFLSSSIQNLFPGLGIMYFPDRNSQYFMQGSLGYTSADQDSLFAISGGIGYELRKYVTLELILGYNRFSDTYTSSYNIFTGASTTSTSQTNIITVSATFNVLFY